MATGEIRVRWELLDPGTYEDMVSVLLSRLKPGTVRVDGKGGDGGRDCYFDEETGREAFELKSFTGRLKGSRRRQVERSLKRAAEGNPTRWSLVVPIDHTPAELTWFEGLQTQYEFPLLWRGKTWLDSEMASHPDIHRYFVKGAAEEVIERLAELNMEQAALARGVEDAADRLEVIKNRLNEIDPFYSFSISITADGREISLHPKYAGAERDRPIKGTIKGTFPDTEEGTRARQEFEDAIGFGLGVELPGEFIEAVDLDAPAGFGGRLKPASISIQPTKAEVDVRLVLKITQPSGLILGQLPLDIRERTAGPSGMIMSGSDKSGVFSIKIRMRNDGRVDFNYRLNLDSGVLPADLGPPLTVLSVFHEPNLMTIEVVEPHIVMVKDIPIDSPPVVEREQHRLIEDLALLQRVSGVHFELPEELSGFDLREIDEGITLLDGGTVELPASSASFRLTPRGSEPAVLRQALEDDDWKGSLRVVQEVGVSVGGHLLPLGQGAVVYRSICITNRGEVLAKWDDGEEEIEVKLDLLEPPQMTLISSTEESG